jgi:uncharacterized protein (DUF2235 family)
MKRLIILCDGTWQDAGIPQRATNVLRLARLIKARAADGTPQVTFYHPGLGSAGGVTPRLLQVIEGSARGSRWLRDLGGSDS